MKIIKVQDYIRHKVVTVPAPDDNVTFGDKILLKGKWEKVFGKVVSYAKEVPGIKVHEELTFLKKLSEKEVEDFYKQQEGEKERLIKIQNVADKLKLKMKFFASRIGWDSKIYSFIFVSDNPVDFRELLKNITKEFSGRIHLQRVDPRERAEIIGGIGPCGRLECCMFMKLSNKKVALDSVRDQGIMIRNNPKIYDVSGKIKRCFLYELNAYKKNRRFLPHLKQEIIVNKKKARVMGLDILNRKVKVVFLDSLVYEVFSVNDIEFPNKKEFEEKPLEVEMPKVEIEGVWDE